METYPIIKVPERFSILEQPPALPRLRPSPWSWLAWIGTGILLVLAWWDLRLLWAAGLCFLLGAGEYGRSVWRYQQRVNQDLLGRRREQVQGLTILTYTQSTDREYSPLAMQLAEALQRIPDVEVRQQQRLDTHIPDVILRDRSLGIWCCIEVDEPWYFREGDGLKCPSHWIGKDERRDEAFLDYGWIVIRFAEAQVAEDLQGCVQEVTSVLARFNPGRSRVQSKLRRVARWTEVEALKLSRVYTAAEK